MSFTTGFYQTDFSAHYDDRSVFPEKNMQLSFSETDKGIYRLYYQYRGKSEVVIGNEKRTIAAGTLVIANPNDLLLIKVLNEEYAEFLLISAMPSFFSSVQTDKRFLRAFYPALDNEKIINPQSFKTNACYALLESFKECLINHSSREHVEFRVFTIISELDFHFDDQSLQKKNVLKTDNLSANLIDYLIHHCTDKITLSELEKLFFVSSTTLNRMCKSAMNNTVLEFVIKKRLNIANEMIKNNSNLSLSKIAEACGFLDYSVFFKAYKKHYGISPKAYRDKIKND